MMYFAVLADELLEAGGATPARQETEVVLGQAELRALGRDAQIGTHRELHAGSKGEAVHGGDHGQR